MSNKLGIYVPIAIASVMVVAIAAYIFGVSTQDVGASAPSGLQATVASTSNQVVGVTVTSIFATTTNCASRVITTGAQAILLTFSDFAGQTPTGSFGHLQAASTTVVYDSGLYGCNLFKAYGEAASSTITTTETR